MRGYVANECPAPKLREILEGDLPFDEPLWRGLAELGIAGLSIPERYGGGGLEMIDLALVSEVMGHGAMPGPLLGHALAGYAVLLGGNDGQKEQWLPRLADGKLALVEREADGLKLEAADGVDRTRRLEHATFDSTPCEELSHVGLELLAADAFGGAWSRTRPSTRRRASSSGSRSRSSRP